MILQRLDPHLEPRGAPGGQSPDAPDGLGEHGGGNALGLGLQQAQDEGPADALAEEMAPVDPQVVQQGQVVPVYVGQPPCAVIGARDWPPALR